MKRVVEVSQAHGSSQREESIAVSPHLLIALIAPFSLLELAHLLVVPAKEDDKVLKVAFSPEQLEPLLGLVGAI